MRRKHKSAKNELAQSLIETKLAIEKARLAKLEEGLPRLNSHHCVRYPKSQHVVRYKDQLPLAPEDRHMAMERLKELYFRLTAKDAAEKQAWLLSMVDFAP